MSAICLIAAATLPASRLEAQGRQDHVPVDAPVEAGVSEWQPSFDATTLTPLELGAPRIDEAILSAGTIPAMLDAINRYAAIVSRGGWPTIPNGPMLRVGVRDNRVMLLRQRLAMTGDLEQQAGNTRTFDSFVERAVRRFQFRHGLNPDGAVRDETLEALNVPALERLKQLRTNVVRINTFVEDLPPRYVLVNIPGAEIEAVDGGLVASRHTAIVGKAERETPVLISKVHELNFNPYWHVPESIVRRDIIPQMQKDPGYLARYVIRVYDQKGGEVDPNSIDWNTLDSKTYLFRQDPGEDINSLGAVKINFANEFAVFLHDTPQKKLFSENSRYFSSGCVRVQNIEHLLLWLLRDNDGEAWSRQKIDAVIRSGERLDVAMKRPTPLYIVYITGWASPNGLVHFRNDVYRRDVPGATAAAN
jgi:murein L,D-transpeptidase YcbB/YkuD